MISTEIQRLQGAKADIKSAIEAKGVTVASSLTLDGYAAKIAEIPTGGGEEAPESDVNFYDYDGRRIASYTIAEAKALTQAEYDAILPPSHEGLTFQEWNWSLSDITSYNRQYADIGANYITTDGKTWLIVRAEENVAITLRGAKASVVVEWGDDTTSSYSYPSYNQNYTFTHTYDSEGFYTIKITVTTTADGGYISFVSTNNTSSSGWFGIDWHEIRVGNNIDITQGGCLANINTSSCKLSLPANSITAIACQNSAFRCIVLPRCAFSTSYQNFTYYPNTRLCFPKEIQSFAHSGAGYAVYSSILTRLVVPQSSDTGTYETNAFQNAQVSVVSLPSDASFNTLANGQYINSARLRYIDIAQGWIPNQNMTFSSSTMWSADNMVKFFYNLGTTQTAITLTFGSTNLNKLTADQKAIATAKGYTLA